MSDTFPGMTERWHPWRYLAERYPHITVITRHRLPGHTMGLIRGDRIWICASCDQAERRSTLTHELWHLDRGIVTLPHLVAREERIVSELAARDLIPLPELIDALKWTRSIGELADELWTDEPTVRVRLNTLDPIEVAQIEHHIGDDWNVA